MFQRLLLRLHRFNFATHIGNAPLHLKHIRDLPCALLQDRPKPLLRLASSFQASTQIRMLARNVFAGLRFTLQPSKPFDLRNSRHQFRSRNPERSLKPAGTGLRRTNVELRRIPMMPSENQIESRSRSLQILHRDPERRRPRNHRCRHR